MLRTAPRLALLFLGLPMAVMAQGAPTMAPGSVQPDPGAAMAAPGPTAGRPAHRAPPAAPGTQARPRLREATPEQMTEAMERHLALLRGQLGITAAQTPAWDQFAQVSRDNAIELRRRFEQRAATLAGMTAADSMADYAAISELHAAELLRLSNAFRSLYAGMNPAQQQAADALFRSTRTPPVASRRG